MRIAFIFAPYGHKRFEENLYVVDEDFGLFPPVNLAYAAAMAEGAGHEVALFDLNVLIRRRVASQEACLRAIEDFAPDLLAFYCSTYMFQDTLDWIRRVRARVDRPVLAGGINCRLYPAETLSHTDIDCCVTGHAHRALPALLDAWGDPRRIAQIPGLACRQDGQVRINPPEDEGSIDFDAFPFPARHLLPNELYHSFISQRKNFTVALTTLGCPFDCDFCAIVDLPRAMRSPDSVRAEVEQIVRAHDIREIDFFDANFTTHKARTMEMLEGIAELGLDLEFSCRSRVDCLDDEVLRMLRRAGCRQIYLGIESSAQHVLDLLRKRIEPSLARETVGRVKRAGIRPLGFFMLGSPGETLQTAIRTVIFSLSLGLDYAQYSRTIAKPGSGLLRQLVDGGHEDPWREYVLGRRSDERLPSPWTQMSHGQIELLSKLAYLLFYYRPSTVLGHLSRIRSLEELSRSTRTALRMLIHAAHFGG